MFFYPVDRDLRALFHHVSHLTGELQSALRARIRDAFDEQRIAAHTRPRHTDRRSRDVRLFDFAFIEDGFAEILVEGFRIDRIFFRSVDEIGG